MSTNQNEQRILPQALKEYNNWVCWGIQIRDGEKRKIPHSPHGGLAKTNDKETWGTFEQAQAYLEKNKHLSGLGFVFSDDNPICGIDLDSCRDAETGKIDAEAQKIIDDFASYTEISPSGKGIHIIIEGRKRGTKARKGKIEIYDRGRYFTMTGDVLDNHTTVEHRQEALDKLYDDLFTTPAQPVSPHLLPVGGRLDRQTGGHKREQPTSQPASLDDQSLIEKAKNAKDGEKFTALWEGDITGYDSHSEADLALCSLLAFWTGRDYDAIDSLFRQSGLLREKWTEREDYRAATITKALNVTHQFGEHATNSHSGGTSDKGKGAKRQDSGACRDGLSSRRTRLKSQIATIRRRKKVKPFDIKQLVSELIISDMNAHGQFYQTNEDVCYYFDEERKRLSHIGDDRRFCTFIEDVYGINASEQEYQFLIASMSTESLSRGELTTIHQFAFYDIDDNILYVYNNDNGIYRLDGQEIQLVDNGADGVLFLGDPLCEPFEQVDIGDNVFLKPLLVDMINFGDGDGVNLNRAEQQSLFMIDIHTKFFEALLPTKPIVAFIGPKGSGKTMAQRLLLKVLFGSSFDVTSIAKEDDFDAAITANYIVAFDNVDGRIDWLNDKLSHTATGKMTQKRKLYTTNENIRFFPKCFLMLNARTPRFKREDVTDRLLLFRTEPLDQKRSEAEIITEVLKGRNEIWSELLLQLNEIVGAFASEPTNFTTSFRMADWAKTAWRIADVYNKGDLLMDLLEKMDKAQSDFLLEDDPIFLCLDAWLAKPENVGREVTSGMLYNDFQIVAQTEGISFTYKSAKSLGMRLRNIINDLREFFEVTAEKRNHQWIYMFQACDEADGRMP